jgi:hypothetical protein
VRGNLIKKVEIPSLPAGPGRGSLAMTISKSEFGFEDHLLFQNRQGVPHKNKRGQKEF